MENDIDLSKQLTLTELRSLSDEEIIQAHDSKAHGFTSTTSYFIEELHRREQDRWLEREKKNTNLMVRLTLFNIILASLALFCAIIALYK